MGLSNCFAIFGSSAHFKS